MVNKQYKEKKKIKKNQKLSFWSLLFISFQKTQLSEVRFIISQNHSMAWVEKDYSDHPVPTLCYVQGRQPPDQADQSHIQPGLQCLQGCDRNKNLGGKNHYADLIVSEGFCLRANGRSSS